MSLRSNLWLVIAMLLICACSRSFKSDRFELEEIYLVRQESDTIIRPESEKIHVYFYPDFAAFEFVRITKGSETIYTGGRQNLTEMIASTRTLCDPLSDEVYHICAYNGDGCLYFKSLYPTPSQEIVLLSGELVGFDNQYYNPGQSCDYHLICKRN